VTTARLKPRVVRPGSSIVVVVHIKRKIMLYFHVYCMGNHRLPLEVVAFIALFGAIAAARVR
jgi:hypothetical protein